MAEASEREIKALIALLDDTDREVFEHVSDKLFSMGPGVIGVLEDAYTSIADQLTQQRIENLIHSIQFSLVKKELTEWMHSEPDDLLKGLLIMNRYQYPLADEDALMQRWQQFRKDIWLGLNMYLSPLEQIDVVNQVLFGQGGLTGTDEEKDAARFSFIGHVLGSGRGNHFSIGLIYLALCQQLGLPVYGVLLRSHFILVRCREEILQIRDLNTLIDEVLFYINPYSRGLTFSEREIRNYIEKAGLEPVKHYFLPAGNLEVMAEYLRFLQDQFTESGAQWKCDDLEQLIHLLDKA